MDLMSGQVAFLAWLWLQSGQRQQSQTAAIFSKAQIFDFFVVAKPMLYSIEI